MTLRIIVLSVDVLILKDLEKNQNDCWCSGERLGECTAYAVAECLEQKEFDVTVFISITAEGQWSIKVVHKVVVS